MHTNNKIRIRFAGLIFILCVIVGVVLVKSQSYCKYEYETVPIEEAFCVECSGYEVQDNHYKMVEEDPKLIYDLQDMDTETYGIRIEFEKAPSQLQIFYADNTESFQETDSVVLPENKEDVVEVAFGSQKAIRIDIDEDFVLEKTELLVNRKEIPVEHLILYPVVFFVSALLAVLAAFSKRAVEFYQKKEHQAGQYLVQNRKKILKELLILLILFVVSFLLEKMFGIVKANAVWSKERMVLIFAVLTLIYAAIRLRKLAGKKVEILFAIAAFAIGLTMIVAVPDACGVSWDDEVHYKKTAELSYGRRGVISYADQKLIGNYVTTIMERKEYTAQGNADWSGEINQTARQMDILVPCEEVSTWAEYVAYIPGAVGLMVARALDMEFTHAFMLGKIMNLLVYIFVFVCAIRMVKRGKMLICAIGLIPTNLFLASTYAYDWWVVCFVVLGYAMYLSELQKSREHTISFKKWLLILGVMILGILPKAVYFVLIAPMFFVKKKCLEEKVKPGWYRFADLCAMGILVATFILPMLTGSGSGDVRAAAGVDAVGQMKFILQNPLEYTKVLLKFIKDYISLDASQSYLTFYSYVGMGRYYVLTLATVLVTAFLEGRRRERGNSILIKSIVCFSVFAAVVLVVTALYVSFTPVGAETVSGCQPRYLLPLVFPVLYFMAECNINTTNWNRNRYVTGMVLILSAVSFLNIYELCIAVM